MTPAGMADLAVIGGGAAAAAMLMAWATATDAPSQSVLWVAPEGEDGRGLAYRTRDPAHRLNVRAERMSLRADHAGDFVDYLAAQDGHADPQAFQPRRRYGDYLAHRVAEAMARLPAERWTCTASAVTHTGGAWQVVGTDGRRRLARHLVLALGPQEAALPAGVDPELARQGRYRVDPHAWTEQPRRSGPLQWVWIIGSGLTAVDLVLTAAQTHPQAEIHLLSRHGALPATHARAHATPFDVLRHLETMPTASQVVRLVREHCEAASDWRDVIDGLRANMAYRWQRWGSEEQGRFLRHVRWAWDRVRHRMAPEVAEAIVALRKSGQLQLHRGRLLGAESRSQRVALRWRPRSSVESSVVDADLVLQATGLNTRVSDSRTPLLRSLLDQGLARPDRLDLGVLVDSHQRLIDARGRVRGDAHVLGALARGSCFECIAMPEIRSTASAIAVSLRRSSRDCPLTLAAGSA